MLVTKMISIIAQIELFTDTECCHKIGAYLQNKNVVIVHGTALNVLI